MAGKLALGSESRGPEIKRASRNLLHHGCTRLSAHPFKGALLLLKKTPFLGVPLQRIATAYGTGRYVSYVQLRT